jgi:hypothetical protein
MDKLKTQILQWARRVRDFLFQYDPKSDFVEMAALRQELEDVLGRLTANAAAQEAITKQSRVQTREIKRLRTALRDGHLKPIVKMSRTMKLEINNTEITFVLPNFAIDNERLAAAGDAMVTALKVLGPQFIAKGFAPNFVEQLSNATKALRDAIDQRSAQVARRTGTTAAIVKDSEIAVHLVGVIDTLVQPALQGNPELLATWMNLVALPRAPKAGGVVVTTPAASSGAPTVPVPVSSTGHEGQAAA